MEDINKMKTAIMDRIMGNWTPKCADDIIKLCKFYFDLVAVEEQTKKGGHNE